MENSDQCNEFVNFTSVMSKNMTASEKVTAFPIPVKAALVKIPPQPSETQELCLLGHYVGKAPEVMALPPLSPAIQNGNALHQHSTSFQSRASQGPSIEYCKPDTTHLIHLGIECPGLIFGIDCTMINEFAGQHSFNGRSLHAIGSEQNPYEQTISIIGQTLSSLDEDNKIRCFGFGDASTHDHSVFSFFPDFRPCNGFEEALIRYREIVPHLSFAGPTSFAPIIEVAMGIVEGSGRQYHVLVIVASRQFTRSSDTEIGCLSPQEQKTINAIAASSKFPLSIVLIGVGDGPWDAMEQNDDNIYSQASDNFQFVNFTSIMSKNMTASEKEAAFAIAVKAALMKIPPQPSETQELRLLGHRMPLPTIQHGNAMNMHPHTTSFHSQASLVQSIEHQEPVCLVCSINPRDMAFGCGHMTCRCCSEKLSTCLMCKTPISTCLRLYSA